jgi:hypothetical protein
VIAQFIALLISLALLSLPAYADTPASQVTTQSVTANQSYPEVAINSEGWFDIGGFCKVVDVGSLTWANPPATGVPVFIPGAATDWENYRTTAPSNYHGDLVLTTCCRPQTNIASLCTEAGATVVSVSRAYGKLGETDVLTATCVDQWGVPYTDSVSVTCNGDNGPDGQAQWAEGGGDSTSNCTPDAYDTGCSAACDSTSTGTRYDSCGVPTNYTCSGGACPPPTPPAEVCTYVCNPILYACNGTNWNDCGASPDCSAKDSCGGCKTGWTPVCSPPPCTPCFCFDVVNFACSAAASCCVGGQCC